MRGSTLPYFYAVATINFTTAGLTVKGGNYLWALTRLCNHVTIFFVMNCSHLVLASSIGFNPVSYLLIYNGTWAAFCPPRHLLGRPNHSSSASIVSLFSHQDQTSSQQLCCWYSLCSLLL